MDQVQTQTCAQQDSLLKTKSDKTKVQVLLLPVFFLTNPGSVRHSNLFFKKKLFMEFFLQTKREKNLL